jgi:tetratricopeptide (TPR) repeat protein
MRGCWIAAKKALHPGERLVSATAFLCLLAALSVIPSRAQEPKPPDPAQQDPGGGEPAFKAYKAIQAGQFYFKKGKYDAAIDRFKEAIEYRPGYGLPYRLIGEAYEKKRFKPEAIEWYEKYLRVQPGVADADKIRKKIETLRREVQREAEKRKKKSPSG